MYFQSVVARMAVTLCFAFLSALCAVAQDEEKEATSLAKEIELSLKSEKKERQIWEGIFTQQRAFHGRTLYVLDGLWASLSEKRQDWGTVRHREGILELSGIKDRPEEIANLVVVPWSNRVYLVEQDRLFAFVNDINSGIEPHGTSPGTFFSRVDLFDFKVEDEPKLPKSIQDYVYKKPFGGVIQRVIAKRERIQIANYGSIASGVEAEFLPDDSRPVFEGMTMTVRSSKKWYRAVVSDASKKRIRVIIPDVLVAFGKGLEIGDYITTRAAADSSE